MGVNADSSVLVTPRMVSGPVVPDSGWITETPSDLLYSGSTTHSHVMSGPKCNQSAHVEVIWWHMRKVTFYSSWEGGHNTCHEVINFISPGKVEYLLPLVLSDRYHSKQSQYSGVSWFLHPSVMREGILCACYQRLLNHTFYLARNDFTEHRVIRMIF